MTPANSSAAAVEATFRSKYRELCASLLGAFGYQHFELVEEALQAACARALERWPTSGVPDNPAGWLYAVARNHCLEALRHATVVDRAHAELQAATQHEQPPVELDQAARAGLDDFAAMILLCCNPDLGERAHVCLMLKAGCGLSVREIARLLDMADEAVKKTLTRARQHVGRMASAFGALDATRIAERFPTVMETIYALFTEGYAATSGDLPLSRDTARQAIHLCDVLLGSRLTPDAARADLHALAALMLLQMARFDARVGEDGVPIRLQDQDRRLWHRPMIQAGLEALAAATAAETPSRYHVEARIAAAHSTSASFDRTNWRLILALYDQLLTLKDTPAVRLNRLVALRHAQGPEVALAEMVATAAVPMPASIAFLRHAVRADILDALGHTDEARLAWEAATACAPTAADRTFVARRAATGPGDVPATGSRASFERRDT